MENKNIINLEKAIKNEEFFSKLCACDTEEQVVTLLNENEIELNKAEMKEFVDAVSICLTDNGELSVDSLDAVSGGASFMEILRFVASTHGPIRPRIGRYW